MAGIVAITVLAGALRLYDLASVTGNPFYDAAVRSMALSWHNFFFAAFEPAGRLAVDKPPVDLWLQVASVKVLGFNSFALKLPEALAGIAAVPLLYDLVRRVFGTGAGLASALALAVLPVTVLTSRSDTMDTVMMLLLVGAAWLVVRSAQTGQARYLYLAAAVLGVDFNVKLFEALLPLPALTLLYVVAAPHPARRQLRHLVAAGLVFVAVSLSWITAVSLTPSSSRPYPIGSSNGSVWNSIFVFDGAHRLGIGGHASSVTAEPGTTAGGRSPTRLLARDGPALGRRVGSELIPAFAFGVLAAGLALTARRRERWARDPAAATRRGLSLALAVWLLTGFVAFSAVGRLHPRYLEAFTPAIAAAIGIGLAAAVVSARRRPGARAALAAALAVACGYALYVASGTLEVALVAVLGLAALAAVLALGREDGRGVRSIAPALAGALCIAAVLVVPASESLAVIRHHATAASTGSRIPPRELAALDRYLRSHQGHARFEVATLNPYQAAPLIARAGQPVVVLFNVNRHRLVSDHSLHRLAHSGQLHYVFLGTACGRAGQASQSTRGSPPSGSPAGGRTRYLSRHPCVSTARWVRAHGSPVRMARGYAGLYRLTGSAGP